MTLKKTLNTFISVVIAEAESNSNFKEQIERALGISTRVASTTDAVLKRKGGRRTPAVLDPVALVRQGEASLKARLDNLDLEQLRDIVAQYGMDPGKLVMKWKDRARVVERIIEVSLSRSTKGDAFRKD